MSHYTSTINCHVLKKSTSMFFIKKKKRKGDQNCFKINRGIDFMRILNLGTKTVT